MNNEQVVQGTEKLAELQWTNLDIVEFCKSQCDTSIRKQIKEGLLIDLSQFKVDVDALISIVNEFDVIKEATTDVMIIDEDNNAIAD